MFTLKHKIALLAVLVLAALACNLLTTGASTPQSTQQAAATPEVPTAPTERETEAEGKSLLVQLPSKEMVVIGRDGQSRPFANPDFLIAAGPHATAGMAGDTFYAMSYDDPNGPHVYAIDASGAKPLDFLSDQTQSIAIGPGDGRRQAAIAWSDTDWQQSPPLSTLYVAPIGGFDVIKVAELSTPEGSYLVPFRFSADGQRLYYSQEPSGLGGYILFGGISSLFVYNQADNTSKELLPTSMGAICIDDLSPDEQLVAHHCGTGGGTSVQDLQTGATTSIALPPELASEVGATGSARFSPDGKRLAFSLARRNPDDEQGWVAVTDDLGGLSRVASTAPTGQVYEVMGWLDNNTLILQTSGENPVVWLVGLDGTGWQRDGTFLALIDR